jgi:predicted O-methyltransferase YrrM
LQTPTLATDAVAACFPDDVPGWFTQAECSLWAETCRDRNVLEFGRYHGRSTTVAAATARNVVSIDRDSEQPAALWLQRYGVRHKVWLRVGEFADLAPSSGGPFSACLIDGAHCRPYVEADIAAAVAQLAPGAVIGFHDYGDPAHPDVQPTADAAAQRFGWRLVGRADFLAVFATPELDGQTKVENVAGTAMPAVG